MLLCPLPASRNWDKSISHQFWLQSSVVPKAVVLLPSDPYASKQNIPRRFSMKWLAKSPGNIWLGWETYRNTAFWRHLAVTSVSIVTNVCVYIQSLCFYQILLHGTAVPSHFTKTDDPDKEQSFHSAQMHIYLIKSKEFKPGKDPVLQKIDYQCNQLMGRE